MDSPDRNTNRPDRKPDSPDRLTRLRRAIDYLEACRWRLAEVECRVILAVNPNDVEVMLILGLAIAGAGEASRAAPILTRVRAARPDHADPRRDLASLHPRVPRTVVVRQYRACLRLAPTDVRLRRDFARYLLENADPDGAISVLREAPDSPETLNLRGMALAETGKFREAARSFDAAARRAPDQPDHWANLAMMLRIEGRFDQALAAHDRAMATGAADSGLDVDRAIILLQAGRWEEAWPIFERRLTRHGHAAQYGAPPLETLAADTRLDGVRVLVWHEEGYGDTIQFARFLPLLKARGAVVTARVPATLVRLLSGMPGIEVALTGDDPPPPHDRQCPFISLARAFNTSVQTVPTAPYLAADAALAAAWSARFPRDPGTMNVGLVWAGQARPWLHGFGAVDRRRSANLAAFAPLAPVRGVRFISLQAGTAAAQGQEPPMGMTLMDPMDAVRDFADTAAIIANLDVVISVDTSVAHLAGAMGKPVFLLDRYDNCWRWMHGRADTPWYPSMTIFRQPRAGDWAMPMYRAAQSLSSLSAFRTGARGTTHGLANAA
jgi:tetratricopeptide (TPR) repeat protein